MINCKNCCNKKIIFIFNKLKKVNKNGSLSPRHTR